MLADFKEAMAWMFLWGWWGAIVYGAVYGCYWLYHHLPITIIVGH